MPTHDDVIGTDNFPSAEDLHTGVNFRSATNFLPASGDLASDLAARLERAEGRIDRLLGIVDEQNRTIQAQTIRLAQLEGRMIDAAPPETPAEPPEQAEEPDIPTARTGGLRAWYRRLRRGH